MAGWLATVFAARICGWLHLADVATSSQPEDAGKGTLAALIPALWCPGYTGTRLQPGVWSCLALALHRRERHCWSAPADAQRVCSRGAVHAPPALFDLEDAWRIGRSRFVVARRIFAAGARTGRGH